MTNPQAEVNYQKFIAFVKKREFNEDWEDYLSRDRRSLNKQAIARECGFDRKRIKENSKIIEKYDQVINNLIKKGILIKGIKTDTDKTKPRNTIVPNSADKKALKNSKELNAVLEYELRETKDRLIKAEKKLKQLEAIENYMISTGRL